MKSFILVFGLSIFLALSLKGQGTKTTFEHQLSVSFTSIQLASGPFQTFLPNTSIMYRHDLGDFKLRLQGQYLNLFNRRRLRQIESGVQQSASVSIGAQYEKTWGKHALYGFLDLGYGDLLLSESVVSSFVIDLQGMHSQVGLGIEFYITKRWQIGVESAATYLWGRGFGFPNQINVFDFQAGFDPPNIRGEFILRPVNAIWLSYAFGEK
ncbi:MAG: hypothetical protein AAF927_18505 [Bacteroidota bacterium]